MTSRARIVRAIAVLAAACAAWPSLARETPGCRGIEPTGWSIRIAGAEEPGERMVVEGKVLGPGGEPVAGARVLVYHTDAAGHYSRGGMDESSSRLCGVLRTDARGRYRVETIRPGPYPGGRTPRHLHYQVEAPRTPPRSFELMFEGDPALDGSHAERSLRSGEDAQAPSATVRPVRKDAGGVLHVTRDLRLPPR